MIVGRLALVALLDALAVLVLALLGQAAYSDSDPPTASVATRVEGASRSA